MRIYGDGDVASRGQQIPLVAGIVSRAPVSMKFLNRGDVAQLDLYWIYAGALATPPAGTWALRIKRPGLYTSMPILEATTFARMTDVGGSEFLRFVMNFNVAAIRRLFSSIHDPAPVGAWGGGGSALRGIGGEPRRVLLEAQLLNEVGGIRRHSSMFNVGVENSYFDDLASSLGARYQVVDAGDGKIVTLSFHDGASAPEAALVQMEAPAAEPMISVRQQAVDSLPEVLQVGLASTVQTSGGRRLIWWAERGDESPAEAGAVRLGSEDVVTADGTSIPVSWASLPTSPVDGEPVLLAQLAIPSGQPQIEVAPVSGSISALGGTVRLAAAVPAGQTYRLMTLAARHGLTAEIAAGRMVVASKTVSAADGQTIPVPWVTALAVTPTFVMTQARGMSGQPEIETAPILGSISTTGVDVRLAATVPAGMSYELIVVANVM